MLFEDITGDKICSGITYILKIKESQEQNPEGKPTLKSKNSYKGDWKKTSVIWVKNPLQKLVNQSSWIDKAISHAVSL